MLATSPSGPPPMSSITSTRSAEGRSRGGLEPGAGLGNIIAMDTHRRSAPPVLDMTPEGEFRDPLPPPRGGLDQVLGKVGGLALLLTLAAGGLLLVALAILFVGLLLPVAVGAGLVAFVSLWWRMRRLRRSGSGPGTVRFVVLRR